MKIRLSPPWKRPPDQPTQSGHRQAEDGQAPDPPPIHQWTGGSAVAAHATTVGLFIALACGPLALGAVGLSIANAEPARPPATQAGDPQAGDRAVAGEIGQRAVVTWLTTPRGKESRDGYFLPAFSGSETPFTVTQPSLTDAQSLGNGMWSVTVAATVADQRGHVARRYYQIPISVTGPAGNRLATVVALPAAVAGPALQEAPPDDYRHQVSSSTPMHQAVTAFLQALAAGQGDVGPYTTPGRSIPAIRPAPYADIQITELASQTPASTAPPADGVVQQVMAHARGVTVENKQTTSLAYALTLRARAGRWEVEAIEPAPRLRDPATRTTPAPGITPPGPGITTPTPGTTPGTTTSPSPQPTPGKD